MRVGAVRVQDMVFPVVHDGDEKYWPIRVVSETLGIGWGAQYAKLQPPRYNPKNIEFLAPGNKKPEIYVCLSQYEFEFWLKTINSLKISQEARQRLSLLRMKFFGGDSKYIDLGGCHARSLKILSRVVDWKVRSLPHAQRSTMKEVIERRFVDEYGCSMRDVAGSGLVEAISSMVSIIYSLGRVNDITALPISARVDMLVDKMVLSSGGSKNHVDYAMVAALMSAVELEQAQSLCQAGCDLRSA